MNCSLNSSIDNQSIKSYLLDKKVCSVDSTSLADNEDQKVKHLSNLKKRKNDVIIKTNSRKNIIMTIKHILIPSNYYLFLLYDTCFIDSESGRLCYYYLRKYRATLGFYLGVLGLITALVFAYALWIFSRVAPMYNILSTNSFYIAAWMIAIGCILAFICIFLCTLYLLSNNIAYLLAALVFLVISAICSIVALGLSSYFISNKYNETRIYFQHSMYDYNKVNNISSSHGIDMIQHKFQCCGWFNQSDWQLVPYYLQYSVFPDSCCTNLRRQIQCGRLFNLIFQNRGCKNHINSNIKNNYIAIIVTQIIFLITQIIGIVIIPFGATKRYSKPIVIYKTIGD